MSAGELHIDTGLVTRLIAAQFPRSAHLPVRHAGPRRAAEDRTSRRHDLRAQRRERLADRLDRRRRHPEAGEHGDEMRDDALEGRVGDGEPRVRGVHVASGVELRATQRAGDECAHVRLLARHVGALEVRRELAVVQYSGIEVVDGRGHRGPAADFVVDGCHASTDAPRETSFPRFRGFGPATPAGPRSAARVPSATALSAQAAMLEIPTPHGPARVHLDPRDAPPTALVLGHGANGGVEARDLAAAAAAARAAGVVVALVEQPYRVAGRRSPAPARQLDAAWTAVVEHLLDGPLRDSALIAGGRSAGARVACRTAAATGAAGVLCLAFPLSPPRRSPTTPPRSRQDELDAVTVP